MIDIHSHILPGIDDGPADWDESIEMCRLASEDMITTIVATPHIIDGIYPNNRAIIMEKIRELKKKIKGRVALDILLGADIHLTPDIIERIKREEFPTINDNGYILLELPWNLLPPDIGSFLSELGSAGTTPVITHVERTAWIQREFQQLHNFIKNGALIQITAMSITGDFGRFAKYWAEKLLKDRLVHIIASDAHSKTGRPPCLSSALEVAASIVGEENASAMVNDTPLKVINGK
ncbi:MAG: tyrosine-protein phosphatase [Thermodesulfobacteriota bacterium]